MRDNSAWVNGNGYNKAAKESEYIGLFTVKNNTVWGRMHESTMAELTQR